jgi:hypothetical protein
LLFVRIRNEYFGFVSSGPPWQRSFLSFLCGERL